MLLGVEMGLLLQRLTQVHLTTTLALLSKVVVGPQAGDVCGEKQLKMI